MTSKTLLLLRHAKSSWDDARLDDHDRPLNKRGRRAASRIGRLIDEQRFAIELVLCSTAARTRETAELVFAQRKSPPPIEFREELYGADLGRVVETLKQVADLTRCVIVIAHNPGLEEFVEHLTGESVDFPTAALAQIEPDVYDWNSFDDQTRGRLVQLWRPRELD